MPEDSRSRNMVVSLFVTACALVLATTLARAQGYEPLLLTPAALTLQPATPQQQQPAPETTLKLESAKLTYGQAGSRWWTLGAGIGNNFQGETDLEGYGAYSYFLAQNVEFSAEVGGWALDTGESTTVGGSISMVFRWHFVNTGNWTVFADIGIGLLLAGDDVPGNGTSFDFLPRVGAGFTRQLTDSGTRLIAGVHWHH